MIEKVFYNQKKKCVDHDEIAAVCQRCFSLALGQQAKQLKEEREKAHEKYLAGLKEAA